VTSRRSAAVVFAANVACTPGLVLVHREVTLRQGLAQQVGVSSPGRDRLLEHRWRLGRSVSTWSAAPILDLDSGKFSS